MLPPGGQQEQQPAVSVFNNSPSIHWDTSSKQPESCSHLYLLYGRLIQQSRPEQTRLPLSSCDFTKTEALSLLKAQKRHLFAHSKAETAGGFPLNAHLRRLQPHSLFHLKSNLPPADKQRRRTPGSARRPRSHVHQRESRRKPAF